MLFGHHGIFSLSPIYLLTLAGIIYVFVNLSRRHPADPDRNAAPGLRMLALLTLILSVIVICFYIFGVNERNRNYGGWTNGLRWLMWLTPFWLLTMLPAADWRVGVDAGV